MLQEQGGSGVKPSGWTVSPLSLIKCSCNQLNNICVTPPPPKKTPYTRTLNIHCQRIKENKMHSNIFLLKKIYFCTSSHKVIKSTAGWPFSIETYSTERFRVHSRREIWWVFILKTLLMTWARLKNFSWRFVLINKWNSGLIIKKKNSRNEKKKKFFGLKKKCWTKKIDFNGAFERQSFLFLTFHFLTHDCYAANFSTAGHKSAFFLFLRCGENVPR